MLHKAAILLHGLPDEQRGRLLSKLETTQAAAVAETMGRLKDIADREEELVAEEFRAGCGGCRHWHTGDFSSLFDFLQECSSEELFDLLAEERSQTIALVLSFLPPHLAGAVMDKLSPDGQFAVVCRIATRGDVDPEVMHDIAAVLRERLVGPEQHPTVDRGVAEAIRILHAMTPASERLLLQAMHETDPQLVRRIRRGMFGVDVAVYPEEEPIETAL